MTPASLAASGSRTSNRPSDGSQTAHSAGFGCADGIPAPQGRVKGDFECVAAPSLLVDVASDPQSQTAPREAEPTSLAYLASTPRL